MKSAVAAGDGLCLPGLDLQLTRYDERGWRATTFYVTGMEHSLTSDTASAWEPTPVAGGAAGGVGDADRGRSMKTGVAIMLLLILAVGTTRYAEAVEGVLVPFKENEKTSILVWKSAKALEDGRALVRAGADARLITRLVSCPPAPGTRVVLGSEDPGLYLREVIVVHGEWAGCRGVVPRENFKKTKD